MFKVYMKNLLPHKILKKERVDKNLKRKNPITFQQLELLQYEQVGLKVS